MTAFKSKNFIVLTALLLLMTIMAAVPVYYAAGQSPAHQHAPADTDDHSYEAGTHEHSSAYEHNPSFFHYGAYELMQNSKANTWNLLYAGDFNHNFISELERPPRNVA